MGKIRIIYDDYLTKEEVRDLICRSDVAVMRAAVFIYNNCLTYEEQTQGTSLSHNGIGFNRVDTPVLTQFARECIKLNGNYNKRIAKVRPLMVKYSAQIAKIVNDRRPLQMKWDLQGEVK